MKRLLAALLVGGFMITQLGVDAGHEYGGNLHWATADRPLRLLDSVKPRWQASLDSAAASWSTLTNLDLNVVRASTNRRKRRRCKFASHAVHVCNYKYGAGKGWAGLAEFSYDPASGHFLRGRIRLNDSTTGGAPASVLLAIACHEIGHTLGLGHYPAGDVTSCMHTPAFPGVSSIPNAHDFTTVDDNHGHIPADSMTSFEDATVRHHDGIVTVRWALPAP